MKRIVLNPKSFKPQVSPSTKKGRMGKYRDDLLKPNFLQSMGPFTKNNGDLYCCIRPLLRLGRILGVLPVSGIFGSEDHLQFGWRSFATATSVLIVVALALNAAVNSIGLFRTLAESGGGNAADIAATARSPILYLAVLIMYAYFISKSSRLITLFSTWRKSESELILKTSDAKLSFHIRILVTVVYTSALVGAILTNLIRVSIIPNGMGKYGIDGTNNETEKFNRMELYFQRYHPFWVVYFSYNLVLSIFLLILNTLSFLALDFVDVVIIAFARALGFKFKTLVEETETRLMSSPSTDNPSVPMFILRDMTWADVRKDHVVLCKLLHDFNSFLSPLIFLSYSINIFVIGMKIHEGLNPSVDRSFMEGLVSAWSFLHLISRIVAISLTASKINDYAHRIAETIQKCASRDYCREVERLERMLGTTALGLSGLGCFVISRPFILVMVSVIFTMEIVLLQATAVSTSTGIVTNVT